MADMTPEQRKLARHDREQAMTKITPEDLRDELIDAIRHIALYWSKQEGSKLDVCDGVAFSILAILDGWVSDMPCSFDLTAHVHPEDEDQSYEGVTISDMLHTHYGQRRHYGQGVKL